MKIMAVLCLSSILMSGTSQDAIKKEQNQGRDPLNLIVEGTELAKSFKSAHAGLKKVSISDRDELTRAMNACQACPVGKRMVPTQVFLIDAVTFVHQWDQKMKERVPNPPPEVRELIERRRKLVNTVHEVMTAHGLTMKSLKEICADKPDTTTKAKELIDQVKEDSKVALAKDKDTSMISESAHAKLQTRAKELMKSWKAATDEARSLDEGTRAKIQGGMEIAKRVNPAMDPSMKAVSYYSRTLAEAFKLGEQIKNICEDQNIATQFPEDVASSGPKILETLKSAADISKHSFDAMKKAQEN